MNGSGGSQALSSLNISGLGGTITDVNVRLNISHTWTSDLDVFLIAPDGTRVELFTDVGGSGDHFTNTVLDSQAGTAITSASNPFSGTYRPEGNLNVLNGKTPNGVWSLEVTNDNGSSRSRSGTINSWSLDITAPSLIGNNLYNAGQITYYFERDFNFTGTVQDAEIRITHKIDDGAVFYLNGVELEQRYNMPTGAVTSSTLASNTIEFSEQVFTVPATSLVSGSNRLSVEVHQATVTSSDLLFDTKVEIRELATPAVPATPYVESNEEWIELHNKGNASVNLGGWELDDAVRFDFDANMSIAPGGYLVIARDPVAFATKYPGVTVVGPWSGTLSNSGERIQLEDNHGNVVDEVRYFDGGRWYDYADGGGCSLELKDPRSDNSLPESWAPSETSAGWKTYTYRAVAVDNGFGKNNFHEFLLGTLDAGEFLIDDISVIEDPDGSAVQFIQNGNFSGDAVGSVPSSWRLAGNHGLHGRSMVVDDGGNKVLKLVSTGASREYHNHIQTTLANSQQVVAGREYEISYRAKWLKGDNQINTRLFTDWLSNTQRIDIDETWGTPGAANSHFTQNAGPTFRDISHTPVIPNAGQAATVRVTVNDPDGISSVVLRYRRDNASSFNAVTMVHQGGGVYQGTVPSGTAGSLAQFYIQATDAHVSAVAASFPPAGPDSGAFIQWQDNQANTATLHNLRVMMRPQHRQTMYTIIHRMSNYRFPATLVVDESEIYYDVGVRLKGSASGRYHETLNGLNLGFDNMQLFNGVHKSIAIERGDQPNQIMAKHLMSNAGKGVASMFDDPIRLVFPSDSLGNLSKTGSALVSAARYSSAWRRSQFQNGSDGTLYNFELLYNPLETSGDWKKFFPYDHDRGVYEFDDLPLGKETYRWGFQIRSNLRRDNYEPLINTAKAMGLGGISSVNELEKYIDVNQWVRTWAWLGLVGNDDIYTRIFDHNFRMFSRPSDDRLVAMPWDLDRTFRLSTNSSLIGGENLGAYLNQPTIKRLFMQHVQHLCQTSFNASYVSPWASHFAAKTGHNFGSYASYVTNRCNYATTQLPASVSFAISTNNGNNFTVNASSTVLQGDGWIDVAKIQINGIETPVTWLDGDTWQITVPLAQGANSINLQALNLENNQVGADSVTITNSSSVDLASSANLVLTELMYHPTDPSAGEVTAGFSDDDDFEFVELLNTSASSIDLTGCTFTAGITYTFPAGTILNGNARIVLARNPSAFAMRYGSISQSVVGPYTGKLDNGGETITLVAANAAVIFSLTYDDSNGWSEDADGGGYTLVNLYPVSGTDLDQSSKLVSK